MKIQKSFFIALIIGFLNINSVFAVTLPAPLDLSFVIKEIKDHTMTANDLVGMQIMVNGTSTAIWNGTSADGDGNSWNLSYTGSDTMGGFWKFTNSGFGIINTVKLDAFGADSVFDNIPEPELTDKSERGAFVYVNGPDAVDIIFDGLVRLETAADPEGDIYRWITFDFTDIGGLSEDESFQFIADTDKVSPIPLPPAAILFLSGIVGLIGLKRRKV